MSLRKTRVSILSAAVIACLGISGSGAWAAPKDAAGAALDYVEKNRRQFGLTGADTRDIGVKDLVLSRHNGVTHVYLQQHYRGIEVWNGLLTVNLLSDGRVLNAGSRFVPNLAALAAGRNARKSGLDAAAAAAAGLGLEPTRKFEVLQRKGGPSEKLTISDGGIAARPIDAQLVWYPHEDGSVRLAWQLDIDQADGAHWWNALVDAGSGELLARHDLIVHDSAEAIVGAIARPGGSASSLATSIAAFPATDGATYRVYPLPLETPADGVDVLVENAADPLGSPLGWHDTGATQYTVTRGNNVHAYADRDANNTPDPGSDPDGGAALAFDFAFDLGAQPIDYQPAAVTNLFYWNNIMHDVTYRYGFDEVAGNFQVDNFAHGGAGNDDVRAEAQDGSGVNNANFGTPVDGFRPRMQMFEWVNSLPARVIVEDGAIAGEYSGPPAGFGVKLSATGPVTGTAFLIDDGVGTPTDGCEPFAVPPGSIPIIDRGACNFTVKVKNAQNAGAQAAIVANNIAGAAIAMGGSDPTIAIPSVMVTLDTGNLFKANLPFIVTLADGSMGLPDRDSDLDAGVIAHEYGHGISNRLTGGPGIVSCLNNAEQMGEGWSDWFGITLTASSADTRNTRRGVGTYLTFQPVDGQGIRPAPYSTDLGVNPATYAGVADTLNISQPHGIGYIWNSMLWEVYWNLVDRHGFNPDIYGTWNSGGNNLAFQLVIDGMKFQVCRPGFVDGRDAILAADVALTGGANQCEIWRGFAKRGLGFSASQGSSLSRIDGVEAFDLPLACSAASFGGFQAPVSAAPAVNTIKAGATVPVGFVLSGGTPIVDTQPVHCDSLLPTGEAPIALASPGDSGLEVTGDLYEQNWKTDKAWKGTCRAVTVRIPAANDAVAYFSFK